MSRHGLLLAVMPGSALAYELELKVQGWAYGSAFWTARSVWLSEVEDLLRLGFPTASSADVTLTARHLAPFPLKEGHDVP